MSARSRGLIGLGIGLAAAGVATAAGVAADRVLRARKDKETDVAEEELDPSGAVVVADDGVPLYVEIDDQDDPVATVVLTHGYAHNQALWSRQRGAIHDAGYRVVAWDLRGHGRSGEGDDSSYTIAQLGRDLATVIDRTTPEGPIVLIGHSMGGMAIMALAQERPELVRDRVVGVALISTSAGGLTEVNYGLGRQLGGVVHRLGPAAVSRVGRRQELFNSARSLGRNVESVLVHRYSFGGPVPAGVVREVADMIFATRMHVIGAFMPTLMAYDGRAALPMLAGIETLILHGTRDRITPIEHGERLAQELPGAELVVVENAGHVLPLEDPELVTRELLEFLRRATRASVDTEVSQSDSATS
ncbi:alpha/beta fold hydrolase [Flexivirga caeni]|uniref:alpha/beta fold hydrolase n=1 Tax=Flexivirga caeni TaxID=2294115 RepID=UPI0013157EC1|nr:alpha/beta hydrolase [Flexivirga caeni]